TIALEAVPPGVNPIDAYVVGSDTHPDAAQALVATGVRVWRNRETAAWVETVRRHNARAGEPIVPGRGIGVLTPARALRGMLAGAPSPGLPIEQTVSAVVDCRGFDTDGFHDQAHFDALPALARDRLDALVRLALVVVVRDEQRLRSMLSDERYV